MANRKAAMKLKSAAVVACTGSLAFCGISLYFNDEKFYADVAMPLFHCLDAENAHRYAISLAKHGIAGKSRYIDPPSLTSRIWNMEFSNPIGLAAGFDKHAEAVPSLTKLGFGFVEVGSITPAPQEGNPRPRVFRLNEDEAVINRYGFNSEGHELAYERLRKIKLSGKTGIVGVNLGKNKLSENAVADYIAGVKKLGPVASYLVINVSSPNTPGLRNLQHQKELSTLLDKVLDARDNLGDHKPPLLLKIAPDLSDEEKREIASVLLKAKKRVDGIIVANSTVSRPDTLKSSLRNEVGGLTGKPLRQLSTETVRSMYAYTKGEIPIIGVGGISCGEDAYEKIRAGASLLQLYTALIYLGPPVVTKVKRELQELLERDGFKSVGEAVGIDHKEKSSLKRT